jgi:hypothetical protein
MRVVALVSLVLVLQSHVATQTGTAAGVEAYLRGDYRRAAEILKPIAAGRGQADPTAAFFMATLYDNGLGVAADPTRACALYVRATVPPNAPFAAAAGELLRRLSGSMGREAFELCNMTASMGLDHRFEPVTFTLEPGHWIAWDLKGAVISYQGNDTRVPVALAFNQPVFLPIRHTELQVDATRSTRRHFMEVAMWTPTTNLQTWALNWRLFEVVRNELIAIATERLTTASGNEPPSGADVDLREWVQLRVNDSGEAEWAVSGATPPLIHVIQSAAEREAERQRTRDKQMRESTVDWGRVQDVHRRPSLRYPNADGCAQVIVYGWSEDRAEAISIRADKRLLQLSTIPRSFDLSARSNGLEVMLHVYARAVRESPMCTDIAMPPGFNDAEPWHASSGTVTIQLEEPTSRGGVPGTYRATVHIVGAEFISGAGQRVHQIEPITLTATVGWVSG